MKCGSFVVVVASLAFVPALAVPGTGEAAVASLRYRAPVAYHVSAAGTPRRLRPQKFRLARRLHTALRHEFTGAGLARTRGEDVATLGVPTIHLMRVREAVRRLPHRHGTRAVPATYSVDQLSRTRNVVTSGPDEPGYAQVDASGGNVDVWTDRQGHVHQTISGEPGAR